MNISKIGFSGIYCLPANDPQQAKKVANYANGYNSPGTSSCSTNIQTINAYAEGDKAFINTSERQFSSLDKEMLHIISGMAGLDKAAVRQSFQHYAIKNGLIVTNADRNSKCFSAEQVSDQSN